MSAGGVAVVAALALSACSSSSAPSTSSGGNSGNSGSLSGTLNGSGSTFQLTFQQAAISSFKSVQPNMKVNYGGGGSGKGRSDLASNVVNYAGSDSPIKSDELPNFKGKTVLYFPVVVGPITVSYNLSGVKSLQLTGPVIANIFQGHITKWNNSAIAEINKGVKLPDTTITIARRSDSSGTTQNFSQFLVDSAGSTWKLGSNSTINWPPSSRGGDGNGGVAQIVKSTPGAIGYVDYADAKASGLSFAAVMNKAGKFIVPTTQSASAAADSATVSPNLTFSAIWAPGASSYPITYQSWDLVYQKQSATNAKLLKAYIGYLLGPGQQMLSQLNYAPLPSSLDQKAKAQLDKIGS